MADILEYKCPHCSGALTFDSSIQKMKCPYCDSEIDVAALKEFDEDLVSFSKEEEASWQTPGKIWQEADTKGLRVYSCSACGGQIIGDENLGATSCPYCGNPVVLMGQFAGDIKPDFVIPFKLDKEAAKEAYFEYLKDKKLLPNLFKNKNHIDEIKGIYVPVWLFDADSDGVARFKATKIRTWMDTKNKYTDTRYYDVIREGNFSFYNVPVDGSSNMPDELMQSVEPFDFNDAVDFQTAYLSGFLADRYDVSAEDNVEIANSRIRQTTIDALKSTISGYNTVTLENSSVNLKNAKAKYAMYPIWILNTTYENKPYLFCMNGQTGKMVGNLPIDKGKLWKYRLLWTGIFAVAFFVIILILGYIFW